MKVLHLVSSNRWTGAAAPALAEVEALRSQGVDARYAYVGGYTLEERLQSAEYARPLIERRQNPITFIRSRQALRAYIDREDISIVHAHLTYDHSLAVLLRRPEVNVVRTFRARRTLRREPFTRLLLGRTRAVAVVNESFLTHRLLDGRPVVFTPPPVDHQFFRPDGPDARGRLGISSQTPLIGVIGKVTPERGFEEAMTAFAELGRSRPEARLMIIGQGPHRSNLKRLADDLEIASKVIWAGYHEVDLPDYFRALDVMLFTRTGSDEGHRAVSEALACGVPVATFPIAGVRPLLGTLADRSIAPLALPEAVAKVALDLLSCTKSVRDECVRATSINGYASTAQRLIDLYQRVEFTPA